MHYPTYVLVRANIDDIESKVFKLLEPYFQDLQVPEYDTTCECIQDKAAVRAAKLTEEKFGPPEDKGSLLRGMMVPLNPTPEYLEKKERRRQRSMYHGENYEKFLKTESPARDCALCHGKGLMKSTENRNGRWDYCEIGGCFSDVLQACKAPTSKLSEIQNCAVSLRGVDPSTIPLPSAIVTPDGAWHDDYDPAQGKSDKERQWADEARSILSNHQDCLLVVVDCHV